MTETENFVIQYFFSKCGPPSFQIVQFSILLHFSPFFVTKDFFYTYLFVFLFILVYRLFSTHNILICHLR